MRGKIMVTLKSVEQQLKKIRFSKSRWNRAEVLELPKILMPDELIYECVNGTYEGGFALLCATNVRLLLVDKKPLKFLTVEDLRFDMINQIDYSHRLFGARISVSAGSKNLKFNSYNQERLRKLIGHVQHCMAETKQQQTTNASSQQQHLEQINQQLQTYLIAQQKQQEDLQKQLQDAYTRGDVKPNQAAFKQPEPLKPSPELSDYLFAQTLLNQYRATQPQMQNDSAPPAMNRPQPAPISSQPLSDTIQKQTTSQLADIYASGMQEIFGNKSYLAQPTVDPSAAQSLGSPASSNPLANPLELNPLRIAYSKLPMALRDRAFVRSAGHLKHSSVPPSTQATANA
jgi:hypothetical protein